MFDPNSKAWERVYFEHPDQEKLLKSRAGHSMTVVQGKLFIIGGSFGQNYFKEFYVLDTDPAPEIKCIPEN
jgi:hypothetical protein